MRDKFMDDMLAQMKANAPAIAAELKQKQEERDGVLELASGAVQDSRSALDGGKIDVAQVCASIAQALYLRVIAEELIKMRKT